MSAATGPDLDAFHVLGAATSRAFTEGTLDLDGLAQVCRHVLDLNLDQARAVLCRATEHHCYTTALGDSPWPSTATSSPAPSARPADPGVRPGNEA